MLARSGIVRQVRNVLGFDVILVTVFHTYKIQGKMLLHSVHRSLWDRVLVGFGVMTVFVTNLGKYRVR